MAPAAKDPAAVKTTPGPGKSLLWFALGGVVLSLLVFRVLLAPGAILFSTDDCIGALALFKRGMPHSFFGAWNDSVLVGYSQLMNVGWTTIMLWLMPLRLYVNWMRAADLVLGSVFLALFLRRRGIDWKGCAVGALTAFWVGSNFTLVYAGHLWKFGVLMWAAAFLWLCEEASRSKQIRWAVLAGGALGALFLEQPDVALFFALALGPYALYVLWRDYGFNGGVFAKVMIPMMAVALLLAFRPLWQGYQISVRGVAVVGAEKESKTEKWNFVTQWSWPPEETIDFIAPGFMGWRSGEPTGPYWGRMGRSAEWETTRQGFQNFKLESQYLGAIPVALALWACWAAFALPGYRSRERKDLVFWSIVLAVTLMLSFGKHFLLYRVFYLLPMVSSVRNPNKFLQVVQMVMGILAAYGLALSVGSLRSQVEDALSLKRLRWFAYGILAVAVILLIWAGLSDPLKRFARDGWGQYAGIIAENYIRALGHAGLLTLLAGALILWGLRARANTAGPVWRFVPWAAVAIMIVDVLLLSSHYVSAMGGEVVAENPVIDALKQKPLQRAALSVQRGFYNLWLTYLFPYRDISTWNYTQMPRMPEDYQQFINQVGGNSIRFWQLCGISFLLAPGQVWGQIQQDPQAKGAFELQYAYRIEPSSPFSVSVIPATGDQPGSECILGLTKPSARYALIGAWDVVPDDAVLARLNAPEFEPLVRVLVSASTAAGLEPSSAVGSAGRVEIEKYRSGYVRLKVKADRSGILRLADRNSPDWHILLDGNSAPVLRCDYLFMGVAVPPGEHEVVAQYRSPTGTLVVQGLGMLACLTALLRVVTGRNRMSCPDERRTVVPPGD